MCAILLLFILHLCFLFFFRQVLDRSVSHRMPLKKMRVLFKKYLDFEEKYGNDEKVQKVKAMATNYIENELRN